MRSYLAEFFGTFVLVFVGTFPIVWGSAYSLSVPAIVIALCFGAAVASMVFAFGKLSGAHINPAVTVGFWFSGRFATKKLAPYIIAQLAGAVAGSALLLFLFPATETLGATLPAGPVWQSFLLEVFLTFALMYVIMLVSTTPIKMKAVAPLAIGGTVFLEAWLAGHISGASMNPARSLGPALVSGNLTHLWLYFAAPLLGAVIAIAGCKLLHTKKCCDKPGAYC